MGLDPTDDLYGLDCLPCYAAGRTPLKFVVVFQGIVRCNPGSQPVDSNYPPTMLLTQKFPAACVWESAVINGWQTVYQSTGFGATLIQLKWNAWTWFYYFDAPMCQLAAANTANCVQPWYSAAGGTAQLIPIVGAQPLSVQSVMSLINMSLESHKRFDIFLKPNGDLVFRFADYKDHTTVKMLYSEP